MSRALPKISSKKLRYLYLCYALFGLSSNNLGIWVPTFFVRVHHISLLTIGTAAGILAIVVGIPMNVVGGYLSDRFKPRMAFTAMAALASIPLWLAMLWGSSLVALLVLNMVLYGLAIMWVGPAAADVHDEAGPHLRGLGIGIFFSAVNLIAYGIGAPLIGKLNDVLGVTAAPEAMRLSLLVCPAACALAALLLWLGARASATPARERLLDYS